MPVLDQAFLQKLGINFNEQTYLSFAEHFETTLLDRVIEEVISTLNEEQLTQLSAIRDDDNALQTWLEINVPELTDIIQDEVDILIGELAENSEQI